MSSHHSRIGVSSFHAKPQSTHRRKDVLALAVGVALAAMATQSFASSDVWDGTGGTAWSLPANWLTDPAVVPGTGDTATFNGAGNGNVVVDLGTGVTVGSIVFDTSSAAAYTIGSGAAGSQTLTLDTDGSILVNASVANAQLINAKLVGGAAAGSINLTNNSATTLTLGSSLTGGAGVVQTLNIGGSGNTTIGGLVDDGAGGTLNLTKTGAGYLRLNGAATNLAGVVNVTGGTIGVANDLIAAGLTGTGTIENATNADKWSFWGNGTLAGDVNTFDGVLRNNNGTNTGLLGLAKQGLGTLVLTNNANNLNSTLTVDSGSLILNNTGTYGSSNQAGAVRTGYTAQVGGIAGANGVLVINGANVNWNNRSGNSTQNEIWRGTLAVGNNGTGAGSLTLNSGSITTYRQLGVGVASGSYGGYTQTGGSANVGGFLAVGLGSAVGIMNISGGTFTHAGPVTNGAGATGFGSITLSGNAAYTQTITAADSGFWVGEAGTGVLTVKDTATLTLNSQVLQLGRNNVATANGTVNLLGGTITANAVTKPGAAATGTFNFNGGTLKANADSTTFMTGLSNAYVYGGGAKIDDGGKTITIGQALIAPTGNGISASGLTVSGGGFINAPRVIITGDGTGATANAIVDASGNLTGIEITNPGVNYTTATFSLAGGGIGNTGAIGGAPTFVANTSGGLTKSGVGRTVLNGINTYTGATTVNAGSLVIGSTGSISTTTGVNVNGSGAKFVYNNAGVLVPSVTVTLGGVDGTGVIDAVNIASNASNSVSNGDGTAGQLTIGALNFTDLGSFNLNVGATNRTDAAGTPSVSITNFNTGSIASGKIVVNASQPTWLPGTYNLIGYSSLAGIGFGDLVKGTIGGLSTSQIATLVNNAGMISLTITGDNPRWSGELDGSWVIGTQASPKNWRTVSAGVAVDFGATDIARFDDTAAGTTNVNISAGNVTANGVTFDNSSKNYTLNGAFGISGSTSLTKAGTGSLTINNANTYSGGTTLNAGTLNLGNAAALGSGVLTFNGGAIDNTSGAPLTLSTNNAQAWASSFTFTGTNNLNLGTGAVTLTGTPVVTTDGTATLTVGGALSGSGAVGISKAGAGTLVLAGNSAYTGATTVNAGTLKVSGSLSSGSTSINNGSLVVESGATYTTSAGDTWVGVTTGNTGNLEVKSGATLNANTVLVGGYNNTGGTGNAAVAGTLNTKNWLVVGFANGGIGTLDINGGTVNVHTDSAGAGNMEMGTWDANTSSTVNLNGGNLNILNNSSILQSVNTNHSSGDTTFNHNSGNVTFYSNGGTTAGGTGNLVIGNAGGGTHTYNLNGGTLTVGSVVRNSGTAVFKMNGGTLKATRDGATLINNVNTVSVSTGGAIIDTNGVNVTTNRPFEHDAAGAAVDGGLRKAGAGTLLIKNVATYTGSTVIAGGTLQLPSGVAPNAVARYTFDALPEGQLAGGTVVTNTGTGGAAMDGVVNHADNAFDSINGTAYLVPGAAGFGNALSLDGFGSSVDITNQIVDQNGAGSWTLSARVKSTTIGSAILSKDNAVNGGWNAGDTVFYMGANPPNTGVGGALPTGVRHSGGFMQGDPGSISVNALDGAWHMLTFVSNGGAKAVYVDGQLVAMTQTALTSADPGVFVRLGFNIDTLTAIDGAANFVGEMDDITFFDGALSRSQVASFYASSTVVPGGEQYLPATTPVSITASGATLDLNNNNQVVGSLAGVTGSAVTLGTGVLTTGGLNTSTAFSGAISGTGGLVKNGSGAFTVDGPNSFSGGTAISAGSIVAANKSAVGTGAVSVASGATLQVKQNFADALVITGVPTINGTVDLTNSGLVLDTVATADLAAIRSLITSGKIVSSTNTSPNAAIGYMDSSLTPVVGADHVFRNVVVDTTGVVLRLALKGDSNLDGTVNFDDLLKLAQKYNTSGAFWQDADFTYDGTVNFDDLLALAQNYNSSLVNAGSSFEADWALAQSLVPEPTTMGALAGAVLTLRRRRDAKRA